MRLLKCQVFEIFFGGGHAGSIRRTGFIHDGSERLNGLSCVHSCQRGDFETRRPAPAKIRLGIPAPRWETGREVAGNYPNKK